MSAYGRFQPVVLLMVASSERPQTMKADIQYRNLKNGVANGWIGTADSTDRKST
jgi:hypothetical protein